MPLLPILIVAVVLAVGESGAGITPFSEGLGLNPLATALFTIAPLIGVVLASWLVMIRCERRLRRGHFPRPLMQAERFARYSRGFIIVQHCVAVLVFGWVSAVRSVIGNPILLDEVIAIGPAILALIGVWWTYYPIDQRVHAAVLIRKLDEGRPVYPTLSRAGYVVLQTRLHLLLMLTPVLIIAGLGEMISRIDQHLSGSLGSASGLIMGIAKIAVGAGVFMLAPLLATVVLDVKPLGDGPLRDTLLNVCGRHAVKIRQLLVWRTNGTLFNAAVMGLIGRLRFVLITDALLETMRQDQVRAVMAHEVGHVRRHHMVWMVVALFACFAAAAMVLNPPLFLAYKWEWIQSNEVAQIVEVATAIAQLAIALWLFGWICRRFERQADTFAVQHLSMDDDGLTSDESVDTDQKVHPTVTANSVQSMCDALDAIARLNAIDHDRPSWRHGSIAWRMDYLMSLIGQPIDSLRIDRTIKKIKIGSAAIVLAAMAYTAYEYFFIGGHVA